MLGFFMLPERFTEKFIEEPNTGCWLWIAQVDRDGYGRFRWKSAKTMAHRFAYEQVLGQIQEGLELDHKCRTPCCVNPEHLEPVTHIENVRRGNSGKKDREKTHCKWGHPFDEQNTGKATRQRVCLTCHRLRSRRYRKTSLITK